MTLTLPTDFGSRDKCSFTFDRSLPVTFWVFKNKNKCQACVPSHVIKFESNVHPCEKVIGMFFQNQIWSRLLDINRLRLVCIERSIEEVKKCQISKFGYWQGPSDETLKKARCQFCHVKFDHGLWRRWVFFYYKMPNFIQVTFNFTNRWSKRVVSLFSDIILHKWYFRKVYTIK